MAAVARDMLLLALGHGGKRVRRRHNCRQHTTSCIGVRGTTRQFSRVLRSPLVKVGLASLGSRQVRQNDINASPIRHPGTPDPSLKRRFGIPRPHWPARISRLASLADMSRPPVKILTQNVLEALLPCTSGALRLSARRSFRHPTSHRTSTAILAAITTYL